MIVRRLRDAQFGEGSRTAERRYGIHFRGVCVAKLCSTLLNSFRAFGSQPTMAIVGLWMLRQPAPTQTSFFGQSFVTLLTVAQYAWSARPGALFHSSERADGTDYFE